VLFVFEEQGEEVEKVEAASELDNSLVCVLFFKPLPPRLQPSEQVFENG
jgi:hypothetical protein